MNRLQNLLLVLWVMVSLLFVAFNWELVTQPIDISYLFMEFELSILLWIILGATGVMVLLRVLAGLESRARRRRAEKEIDRIKSKAFDGLSGEFDKLVNQLQDHLGQRIQSLLSEQPGKQGSGTDAGKSTEPDKAPEETPEKAAGKNGGDKPTEPLPDEPAPGQSAEEDDAPPELSAETAATLAELKGSGAGSGAKDKQPEKGSEDEKEAKKAGVEKKSGKSKGK